MVRCSIRANNTGPTPPMSAHLRYARRDDIPALEALVRRRHAEAGDPVGTFTKETITRDGFGETTQFIALLAEDDAGVCGYALVHAAYESGNAAAGFYLCDMFVDAQARRRGIGRALIAGIAAMARAHGRSFVWWATKATDTVAQTFYGTLGASAEPVVAHTLGFAPFEALAAQAPPITGPAPWEDA